MNKGNVKMTAINMYPGIWNSYLPSLLAGKHSAQRRWHLSVQESQHELYRISQTFLHNSKALLLVILLHSIFSYNQDKTAMRKLL